MSKFPNEVVDRNLIQILCNPEFLIMVYTKLNINLGSCNLAPELKSDIISGQLFKTIGDDIKNESFQFFRLPAYAAHQPHPGIWGSETKETLKNKIVLEAVKLILKIVFFSVRTIPKGLGASCKAA